MSQWTATLEFRQRNKKTQAKEKEVWGTGVEGYQLPFRAAVKQVIVTSPIKSDSKHNSKHLAQNTYQLKKNFELSYRRWADISSSPLQGSENASFDVRRWERTPAEKDAGTLVEGKAVVFKGCGPGCEI